jgi:DNA-nicking Smr family endonuclease
MSADGEPPPRRKRALTRDERNLWRTVTHSVKPLRPRADPADPAEDKQPADSPRSYAVKKPIPLSPPSALRAPKTPAAPPLAPLDRRLRQRLARGSAALDARIDLHGMTQQRAHAALLRFLRGAQADGAKLVLVITGKGARNGTGAAERGVLKRLVPHWLALPEFRALVIGFERAHVAHGGEGALYVRVRRGAVN